ncbi:MAG: hypothetical protein M1821_001271 [Bathelium mastoideum]|nr:MAG: hypothetical protein M1821_001271 [Bathelium mastoideum]
MSAKTELEKKESKRKRSSKAQPSAEEHARKRPRNDHVSPPHDQPAANHAVNGELESRDERQPLHANGELDSRRAAKDGSVTGSTAPGKGKSKKKTDSKSKAINGHEAPSNEIHTHNRPTSQTEEPLLNQTQSASVNNDTLAEENGKTSKLNDELEKRIDAINGSNIPQTQNSALESSTNLHDHAVTDSKAVVKAANKKQKQDKQLSGAVGDKDTDNIYVATRDGVVILWNWVTGHQLGRWELNCHILGLWTTIESSGKEEVIFVVDRSKDGKRDTVVAHKLRYGDNANETASISLYEPQQRVQGLKVLSQGDVVVAFLHQSLAIGQLRVNKTGHSFQEKPYTWHEMNCANEITSFDARIVSVRKQKAKDHSTSAKKFVDVVVGTVNGPIFIYSDLINKVASHSQSRAGNHKVPFIDPKRFHWHREAVGTVKWSKDGNYLISGGKETVLVLWQLETSKKQFLPHLTSDVDSLVVSPSGAAYAVRLVDNSLMVLSTSELKPKTHVAGIQAQGFVHEKPRSHTPQTLATLYSTSQDPVDSISYTPAAFSPLAAHHLLLAVPLCQPRDHLSSKRLSASYLQTFDVTMTHHVARQALTRNNATNFNKGPEGVKLEDPNVKLMRLSCDGKWLATVDEWVPPMLDTDFLAADPLTARREQLRRREVYLKLWRWDEEKETWVLETRVDVPHQSSDGISAGSVDDLVSDPDRVGFATVGEDGIVRIWKPRTLYPNNRLIRGVYSGGVVNWSCQSATRLQGAETRWNRKDGHDHFRPSSQTRLTYSPDGSVLAACQSPPDAADVCLLHLIDTASGKVACTRSLLARDCVLGVALLEKYVVILSDMLIVWDLVEDALVYGYHLDLPHLTQSQKQQLCHITASPHDGTFALALSHLLSTPEQRSKGNLMTNDFSCNILIFSPTNPAPLFASKINQLATALIPGPQSKGYAIIDSSAEIRLLNSGAGFSVPVANPIAGPNESLAELKDEVEPQNSEPLRRLLAEDEGKPPTHLVHAVPHRPGMDIDGDTRENTDPVVRSEKLAEILDLGSSVSLPPVQDMFNAVVALFAQKPRTAPEKAQPD